MVLKKMESGRRKGWEGERERGREAVRKRKARTPGTECGAVLDYLCCFGLFVPLRLSVKLQFVVGDSLSLI